MHCPQNSVVSFRIIENISSSPLLAPSEIRCTFLDEARRFSGNKPLDAKIVAHGVQVFIVVLESTEEKSIRGKHGRLIAEFECDEFDEIDGVESRT